MSAPPLSLLETVARARRDHDKARTAFLTALVRARKHDRSGRPAHSWKEIGDAAGLTKGGARYLILHHDKERGNDGC